MDAGGTPDVWTSTAPCAIGDIQGAVDPTTHKCFVRIPDPENWLDSKALCAAKGMHLAEVRNDSENKTVASLIGELSWLGATTSQGHFVWLDGSTVTFTKWADGEPSSTDDGNCIMSDTNGAWTATDCGDGHSPVCERN
jgi:hypothetical protein